ncbi:MAG: hypothetical protein Q9167_007046 [Letrouitia subvulpina]
MSTSPTSAEEHTGLAPAPTYEYTYDIPSPPRTTIPPPPIDERGLPDISMTAPHPDRGSIFPNTSFLSHISYHNLWTKNNLLDWRYEHRRTAQRVLPFMYLGPANVARDAGFLTREGITLVVGVKGRVGVKGGGGGKRIAAWNVGKGVESAVFDAYGDQDLMGCFEGTVEVVNEHLERRWRSQSQSQSQSGESRGGNAPTVATDDDDDLLPGKVLVFCETGNERSAPVVAAYILAMFDVDMVKAIQIVQAQRFCASFDDAARQLLETWEEILKARRDVMGVRSADRNGEITAPREEDQDSVRMPPMRNFAANRSSKRTLDQVDEGAMDVDVLDKDAREAGSREGKAPFQDEWDS